MKTIVIDASTSYDVHVGAGLLVQTGELVAALSFNKTTRIAIISDSNVAPLYAKTVADSLHQSGYATEEYTFPAGESSKSLEQAMHLIRWLVNHQFTRSDLLLALGGGVTGDLVGFIASIYLRGCDFIQVPTTFLAAVDSSVGGKTAINIPEGKNLVGAFWQPRVVVCDINTFSTLTPTVFADGVAEAIKYGCIWDNTLFETLAQKDWLENSLEEVVSRCIEIKAEVVEQDERDHGLRQILNFGHTIGHSIEKLSNLKISHGQAVAIGMCIVSASQEVAEEIPKGSTDRLKSALLQYDLPTSTTFSSAALAAACLSDKKREGAMINMITLRDIGGYQITPMNISSLEEFIERGL